MYPSIVGFRRLYSLICCRCAVVAKEQEPRVDRVMLAREEGAGGYLEGWPGADHRSQVRPTRVQRRRQSLVLVSVRANCSCRRRAQQGVWNARCGR